MLRPRCVGCCCAPAAAWAAAALTRKSLRGGWRSGAAGCPCAPDVGLPASIPHADSPGLQPASNTRLRSAVPAPSLCIPSPELECRDCMPLSSTDIQPVTLGHIMHHRTGTLPRARRGGRAISCTCGLNPSCTGLPVHAQPKVTVKILC